MHFLLLYAQLFFQAVFRLPLPFSKPVERNPSPPKKKVAKEKRRLSDTIAISRDIALVVGHQQLGGPSKRIPWHWGGAGGGTGSLGVGLG